MLIAGFFNLSILKYIDSKKQFYAFRAKANSSVKFLHFDKHEGHLIYKHLSDLKPYVFKSSYYENLELGDLKLKCNLAIAPSNKSDDESWYIVTNLNPKLAIRKYKKRFGSIYGKLNIMRRIKRNPLIYWTSPQIYFS